MRLTKFKEDTQKVNEGVKQFMDETQTCWIVVARQNNPKFESELRRLLKAYKGMRRGKIPEDIIDNCTKQAMAKHILLEMVGFEDADGDITGNKGGVIEDTYENRLKVLKDKRYSEFVDLVSGISLDNELYRSETEEEDLGNSESSSPGPGPGDESVSS